MEHFEHGVFPELKLIEGYRGAYVMTKDRGQDVEILVMTMWESMDAIHKFAGEHAQTAVVAPAAQAILRSFDQTVSHYEIVFDK